MLKSYPPETTRTVTAAELEPRLLSVFMIDPEHLRTAQDAGVTLDSFRIPRNRTLFKALLLAAETYGATDAASVAEALGETSNETALELFSIDQLEPTSARLKFYVGEIQKTPWPAPREFSRSTPPLLDIEAATPRQLGNLRAYVQAEAEALQVAPEAVAPLALGIVAGCIGRTVETEARPGWIETASLWFAVLLPAGERKSALVSALQRPVVDWQREESERLRAALASYGERRRCTEAELTSARGRLAKSKRGTPDRDELQGQVSDLAEELDRLPALAAPCLPVSDFTPESLRDALRQNGEKAIWIAPEADAPALLGSRYSNGGASNFDLLLKCHCGDAAPASRVGRDVSLDRPALAVALCVQPAALETVLRDNYARDRGLLPRLLLVTPPSKLGHRETEPPPVPDALRDWWGEAVRRLLALPWPGRVVIANGIPTRSATGPRILTLTPDARATLDALRIAIEPRLGEDGDLRPVASFASKLPGACVRIATAFALIANPQAEAVTGEEMRAAVAWSDFLIAHYRHALGTAAEPDDTKLARRILAVIRRNGWREFAPRDAQREVDGNGGVTVETVREALAVLEESGWVRLAEAPATTPGKSGRPPSARWQVNPAAFGSEPSSVPFVPETRGVEGWGNGVNGG